MDSTGVMISVMGILAADAGQWVEELNIPAVGGLGFGAFTLAFVLYRNLRSAQIELTDKYIAENTRLRQRIDVLEAEAQEAVTAERVARNAAMTADLEAHRHRLTLESEIASLKRRLGES